MSKILSHVRHNGANLITLQVRIYCKEQHHIRVDNALAVSRKSMMDCCCLLLSLVLLAKPSTNRSRYYCQSTYGIANSGLLKFLEPSNLAFRIREGVSDDILSSEDFWFIMRCILALAGKLAWFTLQHPIQSKTVKNISLSSHTVLRITWLLTLLFWFRKIKEYF